MDSIQHKMFYNIVTCLWVVLSWSLSTIYSVASSELLSNSFSKFQLPSYLLELHYKIVSEKNEKLSQELDSAKTELLAANEQIDEMKRREECPVCLRSYNDGRKQMVLDNCGHCCCNECVSNLPHCPVCRKLIAKNFPIFPNSWQINTDKIFDSSY